MSGAIATPSARPDVRVGGSVGSADDRLGWRAAILVSAKHAFEAAAEPYPIDAPITVDALAILAGDNDMKLRDVDNLLKQALDALQGALVDTAKAARAGVIRNDHLAWKATVETRHVDDCAGHSDHAAVPGPVTRRASGCEIRPSGSAVCLLEPRALRGWHRL